MAANALGAQAARPAGGARRHGVARRPAAGVGHAHGPTHFFSRATDRVLWHRTEGGSSSPTREPAANLSPRYLFLSFGEYNFLSIARGLPVELVFFLRRARGLVVRAATTRRRSLVHLVVASCSATCRRPSPRTNPTPCGPRGLASCCRCCPPSGRGRGRLLLWAVGRLSGAGAVRRAAGGVYLAAVLVATAPSAGVWRPPTWAPSRCATSSSSTSWSGWASGSVPIRRTTPAWSSSRSVSRPTSTSPAFAGIAPAEFQRLDKVILRRRGTAAPRWAIPLRRSLAAWHDWRGRQAALVGSRAAGDARR